MLWLARKPQHKIPYNKAIYLQNKKTVTDNGNSLPK